MLVSNEFKSGAAVAIIIIIIIRVDTTAAKYCGRYKQKNYQGIFHLPGFRGVDVERI